MVFRYKLAVERSDYLEIHAAGVRSVLGIVIAVFGIMLLVVGAGLSSSANMRIPGGVLLAAAGVALIAGVYLIIMGLVKKRKIIVDGRGRFIELSGSNVPFDEVSTIELHTISRSWKDMDAGVYFERLWIASLLMKKEIPLTKKVPSFMLEDWARHKLVKELVPMFQAGKTTEKPLVAGVSERSSAPEFYDLVEKVARVSGLKLEDKTADDLAKESSTLPFERA